MASIRERYDEYETKVQIKEFIISMSIYVIAGIVIVSLNGFNQESFYMFVIFTLFKLAGLKTVIGMLQPTKNFSDSVKHTLREKSINKDVKKIKRLEKMLELSKKDNDDEVTNKIVNELIDLGVDNYFNELSSQNKLDDTEKLF